MMIKFCGILVMVSFLAVPVNGIITFRRTFGGENSDIGRSVHQTSDGGYIVGACTKSLAWTWGDVDFATIKTDSFGDEKWRMHYGGTASDICYCIDPTSDGGYIMIGSTNSMGAGSFDFWVVKTDGAGNQLWGKSYGSIWHDEAYFIEQTTDGGYIATGGHLSFDLCMFKLNSAGDSVWMKKYGIPGKWEVGYCIRQTSDGGYIVVGYTSSEGAGGNDVWLIRTDDMSNTQWDTTFGGTNNDEGKWVEQTSDGGFIITGYTESYGAGGRDVWLIKVNASGDIAWSKTYGGGQNDEGYCVRQISGGGYIVVGSTASYGAGGNDIWLIKTDASGNTVWSRTHGGINGDVGYSVEQTSDGGYIICGYTGSSGAGIVDVYLLKTDESGNIGVEENQKAKNQKLAVFPNPTIGRATLRMESPRPLQAKLKLYDITGRELTTLFTGTLIGEERVTFRASPGVYFVRLETEAGIESCKLIFLR